MDRRDFLKTVAITGAAMTIQRSEAMEILTQTINKANGDKPDLVAFDISQDHITVTFHYLHFGGSHVPSCYQRAGRYEAIHQTRTESGGKAQYRMG